MSEFDDNAIDRKHESVFTAITTILGDLSNAESADLKNLIEWAGAVHVVYDFWYSTHWPNGIGLEVNEQNAGSAAFSTFVKDWRQPIERVRLGEHEGVPVWKGHDDSVVRKNKRGRGPWMFTSPEPKSRNETHKEKMERIRKRLDQHRSASRGYRAADLERLEKKLLEEPPKRIRDGSTSPEKVGTLFLYWAFEAVSKFYAQSLSGRDASFDVQRERNDPDCNTAADFDNFSEAAKVAFTLAQGFDDRYELKDCSYVVGIWDKDRFADHMIFTDNL